MPLVPAAPAPAEAPSPLKIDVVYDKTTLRVNDQVTATATVISN